MKPKRVFFQEGTFPSQCSGCRMCELVCSFTHHRVFNPSLSRIRVVTLESTMTDFPVTCRFCVNPPCHEVCPTLAMSRNASGVNLIDQNRCIGCGECVTACPFGAIFISPEGKCPLCCDLCISIGEPQCVKYCPRGVLIFTTSEELALLRRAQHDSQVIQYPRDHGVHREEGK